MFTRSTLTIAILASTFFAAAAQAEVRTERPTTLTAQIDGVVGGPNIADQTRGTFATEGGLGTTR